METGLNSILTCPLSGYQKAEKIPQDACVYFYECAGCGTVLKSSPGDFCVFCSCGTVRCPYRVVITRSILVNTTLWTIALTLIYLVFVRFTTRSHQPTA